MSDPMLKLKLFARLEMTLLRLQVRRYAIRIAGMGLALIFLLFALGMLNLQDTRSWLRHKAPHGQP